MIVSIFSSDLFRRLCVVMMACMMEDSNVDALSTDIIWDDASNGFVEKVVDVMVRIVDMEDPTEIHNCRIYISCSKLDMNILFLYSKQTKSCYISTSGLCW